LDSVRHVPIKFQDKFNGIIDEHSDYGHDMVNINAASVGAFFFFVATIAGALGVHGYRGRNRWCYLLHILLALFIALTFFALFIHSIVQFNAMHSNVNELNDKYEEAHKQTITPGGNQTAEELAAYAAKEEFKLEKFDMDEIKTRLMFPVILFLVNIVVYLSSASFAWKSWQQLIDGSAGMSPFENEDDKPDSNPIE